MFLYKIDIVSALKNAGYSTYKIRKDKIFAESTMTDFRQNKFNLSISNFDKLCNLLQMQPGDLLEWVPDNPEDKKE